MSAYSPRDRLIELAYCIAAAVMGAIQAWPVRYQPSTEDLVSYLDIGDAWVQGHWKAALNGYWNPLYSWVMGCVLAVVRPSLRYEYPTVKAVDYVIFLICLWSFGWFLKNLVTVYRLVVRRTDEPRVAIPDWAWIVGGYTLFVWSSLRWITVISNTPDMAAAALTYLAWGLVLRLEQRERQVDYLLLGLVLALAYYSRTPMLIVGAVLLAFLALEQPTVVRRRGAATAFVVLIVLTLPFIGGLSIARGHLTIGDNAKLNHAWGVNPGSYIIPDRHWQGGPAGYGAPVHPERLLWGTPPTFEFAIPVPGTYPPWTDPSYWYQGLTYRFNAAAEWQSIRDNLQFYFELFGRWLLLVLAVLMIGSGDLGASLRGLRWGARYWVPAVVGLALYLVAYDLLDRPLPPQPYHRYLAAFVVLLCLTTIAGIRFRHLTSASWLKVGAGAALVVSSVGLLAAVCSESLLLPNWPPPVPPWVMAQSIEGAGVVPGMLIAVVGRRHEMWARLARVQIIAQVQDDNAYWATSRDNQEAILHQFARTKAQMVVCSRCFRTPEAAAALGWQLAAGTDYAVRSLTALR